MAIFNSYVKLPEGKTHENTMLKPCQNWTFKSPLDWQIFERFRPLGSGNAPLLPIVFLSFTLWIFNIAMENGPFINKYYIYIYIFCIYLFNYDIYIYVYMIIYIHTYIYTHTQFYNPDLSFIPCLLRLSKVAYSIGQRDHELKAGTPQWRRWLPDWGCRLGSTRKADLDGVYQ